MNLASPNVAARLNPEMVALAREARGFSQKRAADQIGISQGHYSRIEAGLLPATPAIVHALVAVFDFPEEFFVVRESLYGPGASEFFHRKRQALSARLLHQVHAQVNIRLIHLRRLLRAAELPADAIPRLDLEECGSPAEAARAVRAMWQLPKGPVRDLTRAIEDAGALVVECEFGTPMLDALSRLVPGLPKLFFVNRDLPGDRNRLTLAHELGHVVLHSIPHPHVEEEAFLFAAEFLMPEQEIRPQLDGLDLSKLAALKSHWRVSMAAILRRATELGKVTPRHSRHLWMLMGKAGMRTREPAELEIPREIPTLLNELLRFHIEQLAYSNQELASLVALEPSELEAWYGLRPELPDARPRLRLVVSND